MEVDRRALLVGAVGVAAAGAVWVATTDPLSGHYESFVSVRNERSAPVTVDLTLRNRDGETTVLGESVTLAPGERFRREGVLSRDTRYRISVRAGELTFDETFRTHGRGYEVGFVVHPTELEARFAHHD